MRIATVESATLATVGYDEAHELLRLEFGSRAVYLYFGVPVAVYEALLGAPSKGRCFHGTNPRTLSLSSDPERQSASAECGSSGQV